MNALQPIGLIRTPFLTAAGTPIQPLYGADTQAVVEVEEAFAEALADIEDFERIWLLYHLDRSKPYQARVVPYRDTREHGLFATRSPNRPNPLGMSVVRLLKREGRRLHISDVDILDGTPLLDIKPYVPQFDAWPDARAGWFDEARVDRKLADERFHAP